MYCGERQGNKQKAKCQAYAKPKEATAPGPRSNDSRSLVIKLKVVVKETLFEYCNSIDHMTSSHLGIT